MNMNNNDKLKKIDIKNHTCYYFGGIIKIEDFNLDNILIDEKSFENILLFNISQKTLIDVKPLRIRFDKIDEFIRVYDGARYLTLFGSEKYDFMYKRIKHVIEVKNDVNIKNQSRLIQGLFIEL